MITTESLLAHKDEAARIVEAMPKGCFIGGSWQDASDGSTFDVRDPATSEVLAQVANGTTEDASKAVEAASSALSSWAASAPRVRAEVLRRAFSLMSERAEDLARLIVVENGKALADARGEVAYAAEFFRWYSEEAVRNVGSVMRAPAGTNRILVTHQPIGVAVLVTPWNFPAAMLTRKIGPALAAGCTVVCKPASQTPLSAFALAGILAEAGVPEGVVNIVPSTRSSAVVGRLLADARVRKLSFTGSTEVGVSLLEAAARRVVSCSMELGGNAPFLVFDDADLEAAIAGAMVAKLRNGGEACTAANRFYVQEKIAPSFSERLASAMAAVKMGPGLDETVRLGPLVNEAGREKVLGLVQDALARGAEVLCGGEVPDQRGYYYPPTVLGAVDPASSILSEEIFGPVAPIVTFKDEEEAVALANETAYGLVSYVYTGDLARGLRVCEALESGMVGLNRGLVSDPAAPFGGVKESGIGREGGHEGLLEYLEAKYIACEW
jgi:succinate-semialdehyde dehydrogenase/glutarate-semialdehyde dehydrogenase